MHQMNGNLSERLIGMRMSAVIALFSVFASAVDAAEPTGSRMSQGFSYQHFEVPEKPWSIHIVKIDRSNPDYELQTTLAKGSAFGLSTLSEHVRTITPDIGRPVAAINGDYYHDGRPYVGDPKGLQIQRGELISAPSTWTCFWIDTNRQPHMTNVTSLFEVTWPNGQRTPIGLNEERGKDAAVLYTAAVGASTGARGGRELVLERVGTNSWLPLQPSQNYLARVREVRETGDTPLAKDIVVLSLSKQLAAALPKVTAGTELRISTATFPSLSGVRTGLGGGPLLLRQGKVINRNQDSVRHPRSAIGWNKDFIFLVEVDGRQRRLSVGMTDIELSEYLISLGCQEAMSLDGGGSSTCWVRGQIMNNPSEGRERGMANALVLVQKNK
jgi:hypothetical protein